VSSPQGPGARDPSGGRVFWSRGDDETEAGTLLAWERESSACFVKLSCGGGQRPHPHRNPKALVKEGEGRREGAPFLGKGEIELASLVVVAVVVVAAAGRKVALSLSSLLSPQVRVRALFFTHSKGAGGGIDRSFGLGLRWDPGRAQRRVREARAARRLRSARRGEAPGEEEERKRSKPGRPSIRSSVKSLHSRFTSRTPSLSTTLITNLLGATAKRSFTSAIAFSITATASSSVKSGLHSRSRRDKAK
jgi:hypothetical protein